MGKRARSVKLGGQLGWKIQGILGEVVLDRCNNNLRRSLQVLNYIAAWGVFYEIKGEGPATDRDFEDVLSIPFGTASRWKRAFWETFPELEDPSLMWEQVKSEIRSRSVEAVTLQVGAARIELGVA